MDLNNIYGDYGEASVTMMLQFVYKGDYTLAVQLYHNHALYGRKYFNMLLMGFLLFSYVILFFSRGLAIISHSENAECIVFNTLLSGISASIL